MIATSDRWKRAVRESGERILLADLYYSRQPKPVLTGLDVTACSVTIDSTATNRRTGTITLANSDLVTENTTLSLEPYGFEIGIRAGVTYPNGDREFVQIGVFPFKTTSWADEAGSIPTLDLYDRSYSISTQSSKTGIEDYGGKSTVFAIGDLISKSVFVLRGTQSVKVDPTGVGAGDVYLIVDAATTAKDVKLPGGAPMQGDFWDDITQLATSLGAQIYFDVDGVNIILEQTPVLPKSQTVFDSTFDVGPYGNIISAPRSLTRDGAWNAVQATGALPANAASAQTPPYVFVYDSDSSSKTYLFGPFGRIIKTVTSDTITDKTALLTFANSTLAQGLGLAKAVSLTVALDPSLDVGDVVQCNFLNGSSELHMLLSIEHDYVASTMSVTTLSQNQV